MGEFRPTLPVYLSRNSMEFTLSITIESVSLSLIGIKNHLHRLTELRMLSLPWQP
jgi:hypothetical protein